MKSKVFLTSILLAVSNLAFAQGGLSIDNVEQVMNADRWVETSTDRQDFIVQGPTDQFNVDLGNREPIIVDTNELKHAYDGQS